MALRNVDRYFLDTLYLVALAHERDQWHAQAVVWAKVVKGTFWTTEYVLLELANSFRAKAFRGKAVLIIDQLRARRDIRIISQPQRLFNRGLDFYRARADKDWSLTDCLSFVVMSDENLTDALTHDHHFEQAGFRALLRTEPPAGRAS